MRDIIIIGGGPAGVSAALTAKNRGKSVKIISNPYETSYLYKAALVENYPGLPNISGADMLKTFREQIDQADIEVINSRALSAMYTGKGFSVAIGQDFSECRALILAIGVLQQKTYPGESALLGKGVSYCATCDGMLYRGKKVALIGLMDGAEKEAEFLRSIGCTVEYFDKTTAKNMRILGDDKVSGIITDGVTHPVDGVFILRSTIAPDSLIVGLEIENGHIVTDADLQTSVKGVFAAGDCIGRPYQIARAVGQGNTAALSACEFLDLLDK